MMTSIVAYIPTSKMLKWRRWGVGRERERKREGEEERQWGGERERETETIIKAIYPLFYLERGYSRIDRPGDMEVDFLGSNLGSSA